MLDLSRDIDSLTNFKKNTATFLQRMRKTGAPIVLTVDGKAKVVVQDAAAYQRLRRLAAQMDDLEFLRQSIAEADAGKCVPAREAIESLGKRKPNVSRK